MWSPTGLLNGLRCSLHVDPGEKCGAPLGLPCRGLQIKGGRVFQAERTQVCGEEWKRADIWGPRSFKNICLGVKSIEDNILMHFTSSGKRTTFMTLITKKKYQWILSQKRAFIISQSVFWKNNMGCFVLQCLADKVCPPGTHKELSKWMPDKGGVLYN